MSQKFKILSAPILLSAVFFTIIASAVLYFHNFAHAQTSSNADLGITNVSFILGSNNVVRYTATIKNTGMKASTVARNFSFYIKNG